MRSTMPSTSPHSADPSRLRRILTLSAYPLLFAAIATITIIFRHEIWDLASDPERLRDWVREFGIGAPLMFLAVQVVQVVVFVLLTLTSQDLTTLRGVFTFIGIPPGRFTMLQTTTRVEAVHKVKRLTTYHSMMMMMMVLPVLKQ